MVNFAQNLQNEDWAVGSDLFRHIGTTFSAMLSLNPLWIFLGFLLEFVNSPLRTFTFDGGKV
jgi:hypothetical protein